MSITVTVGRPPPSVLHALSEDDAAAASGLFLLGGLAFWAETGSPALVLSALILIAVITVATGKRDSS